MIYKQRIYGQWLNSQRTCGQCEKLEYYYGLTTVEGRGRGAYFMTKQLAPWFSAGMGIFSECSKINICFGMIITKGICVRIYSHSLRTFHTGLCVFFAN